MTPLRNGPNGKDKQGGEKRPGHPSVPDLALYSRSDLNWWTTLRISSHLRNCEECEGVVQRMRSAVAELQREAETQTLTAYEAIADWKRLEGEMLGNITVGLAAARCVQRPVSHVRWGPTTLAAASVAVLFVLGWYTHIPARDTLRIFEAVRSWAMGAPPPIAGISVRSMPDGVAVRSQGAVLTMRHPPSAVVSVGGSAVLEARFVDEDSGQVTISSVYGQ